MKLDEAAIYGDEQLWLFMEMADAETNLDEFLDEEGRLHVEETWNVLWEIVEPLAGGGGHADFEHRNLHAASICIELARLDNGDLGIVRECKVICTFEERYSTYRSS